MTNPHKPIDPRSAAEIERLTFAIRAAGIGTWDLDPINQYVRWDDRCKELYGFSKDDIVPYEQVLAYILPDDRKRVYEAVDRALNPASGGSYDIKFRTIGAEDGQLRWLHCQGQAYFNEQGEAYRFSGIAQDVTPLVKQQEQLAATARLNKLATEGAGVGTFHIRSDDNYIEYDPLFAKILTGQEATGLDRNAFIKYIHPEDLLIRQQAYEEGVRTGRVQYDARFIWYDGSVHWARVMGHYIFDEDRRPRSFTGIALEVTQMVKARHDLEASEQRFRSLVQEAPVATCLFVGREMRIDVANDRMIGYWGKDRSILGKPLTEALPELIGQPFLQILDEVYTTGIAYEAKATPADLVVDGQLQTYYFDFTYKPLRNAEGVIYGIMDMAVDVTEEVLARKKLEESELFSRSVIERSPVAKLVLIGEDMRVRTVNENMLEMLGRDASIIGQPLMDIMPELRKTPLLEQLRTVLATGETFVQPEEKFEINRFGEPYTGYYNYIYKALHNTQGERYGVIITATEVTTQVLARQQVEEAEAILRGAIELAELATWDIDIKTRQIHYSRRFQDWIGLPGNSRSLDVAYRALPEEYREAIREELEAVIRPGSEGFYDNEHPIINQQTGQTRIIHMQAQVFHDADGRPAVLRGTAQDVTAQRKLQLALEQLVQERTEELAATNEELAATNEELSEANQLLIHSNQSLERFAYIASHDLQEPLRKVQAFGEILHDRYATELGEGVTYLERIQAAASRMSMLIRDLLTFSRISTRKETITAVSLADEINEVLADLDLRIQETGAVVEVGSLPVVQGAPSQLGQLFLNLLSNALKFRREGVPPVIRISARRVKVMDLPVSVRPTRMTAFYHQVDVADNGIGFDEAYLDRIFEVFQRLHTKTEFPGTGIGLAICEKVMANHGGAITASSRPGQGATFSVFFPIVVRPEEA